MNKTFLKKDISGMSFDGLDMRHALFRGSDLSGCSFIGTNLSHANLVEANIDGCDFTDAIMFMANTRDAIGTPILTNAKVDGMYTKLDLSDADTDTPYPSRVMERAIIIAIRRVDDFSNGDFSQEDFTTLGSWNNGDGLTKRVKGNYVDFVDVGGVISGTPGEDQTISLEAALNGIMENNIEYDEPTKSFINNNEG